MTGTDPADQLRWGISRLASHTYDGGLHGTCYECPFASPPLRVDGSEAEWSEVHNDPTEAYFRCSLPTRAEGERVEWGEYAPCTETEWVAWLNGLLDGLKLVPDGAEVKTYRRHRWGNQITHCADPEARVERHGGVVEQQTVITGRWEPADA
jgi:hypothetical protein